MGFGVEVRAALDFGDLATDIRDVAHALAIHRRGVQAHEAAFLDDLAVGIQLADRDVIRVGRTVHTARVSGLGEGQQQRLVEVVDRVVFDTQVFGGETRAQQAGQAEERLLVIRQLTTLGIGADHEFFIAEEGEVVAHQPFQEVLDLGLLGLGRGIGGLLDQRQQFPQLGFHRLEIGHRNAHFSQHLLQLAAQHVELGGVGAAVDLQVHQ
ncbi:hypothetical protein D3C81_1224560 [compost metagenome]